KVAQLLFFRFEISKRLLVRFYVDRNPLYDFNAGAFNCCNLVRVVRNQFDSSQAKLFEDIDTALVLAQVGFKPKRKICFDSVLPGVLKLICANLVCNTDASAFLLLIDDYAKTLVLNNAHRVVELAATIAFQRMKNIAGETLRMNANQR